MESHHSQHLDHIHSDNTQTSQPMSTGSRQQPPHQQTKTTTRVPAVPMSVPRRTQSMPDKIPITVLGEDYEWQGNSSSLHQSQGPHPPVAFSPPSISFYQEEDHDRTDDDKTHPFIPQIDEDGGRTADTYPGAQRTQGAYDGRHHEVSFSSSSSSRSSNDEESTSHLGDAISNDSSRSDAEVISEEDSAPEEFSFNLAHLSLQQTYATTKKDSSARRSSTESSSVKPSSPKRIKQEHKPMLCAMHQHQKFLHAKKQRNDDRKMERDAAMAAAMFYGECYIEGVGMSDAEKAVGDSHKWYKKWYLQDVDDSGNLVASLGDGYRVPIFNSQPGETMARLQKAEPQNTSDAVFFGVEYAERKKSFLGETLSNNDKIEKEDCNHQKHGDTVLTSVRIDDEEHQNLEVAGTSPLSVILRNKVDIDRNSGAQNPPISQHSVVGKKRQRNASTVPSCDSNSNCDRESACSSTDETIPVSNLHEPPKENHHDSLTEQHHHRAESKSVARKQSTFESFRDERMERERRASTYSDYDTINTVAMIHHQSPSAAHKTSYISNNTSSPSVNETDMNQAHQPSQQHTAPLKCNDEEKYNAILTSISPPLERTAKHVENAKMDLIRCLSITEGDVTSPAFLFALEQLRTLYAMTELDARYVSSPDKRLEGAWLTISRPHYTECLGTNINGEYMYSLGRMSFDMFAPGNLICSIHGIFNSIDIVQQDEHISFKSIPASLRAEVEKGDTTLRRYK